MPPFFLEIGVISRMGDGRGGSESGSRTGIPHGGFFIPRFLSWLESGSWVWGFIVACYMVNKPFETASHMCV